MDNNLDLVIKNAKLILFCLDRNGILLALEGHDTEKLGLSNTQILGKSVFKFKNIPIQRSHFKEAYQEKKTILFTLPIKTYVYETTLTPILDDKGEVFSLTGVAIDVTSRIRTEHQLDEERYRATAAQRINSLAGIANGLAHEINNPLAIISGFSQHISAMVEEENFDRAVVTKILARIVNSCERIHEIIKGLQNFSRNADDDPILKEPLHKIIEETYALCEARFKSDGTRLVCHQLPSKLKLECRSVQISQAIFNILLNAQEAAAKSSENEVKIEVLEDELHIKIRIMNSGAPIEKNLRTKIFEPFFTTKEVDQGVGLGLSTAKGLIESHHGTLTLEPSKKGASFLVDLPKKQKDHLENAS